MRVQKALQYEKRLSFMLATVHLSVNTLPFASSEVVLWRLCVLRPGPRQHLEALTEIQVQAESIKDMIYNMRSIYFIYIFK